MLIIYKVNNISSFSVRVFLLFDFSLFEALLSILFIYHTFHFQLSSARPYSERIASRVGADKMTTPLVLQALLPGSTLPYYGDEISMVDGIDVRISLFFLFILIRPQKTLFVGRTLIPNICSF